MHDARATPGLPQFRMPAVARVRSHYARLCAASASLYGAASLAGRLLLIDGLPDEGDAILVAASIAGGASLVLEMQTEAIRHCIRNGIVDFAVTTLGEALRILKNEVRKQQPIAVLLEGEPAGVLAEMVERGAQPDLLRWAAPEPALKPSIDTLRERGAQPLPASVETAAPPDRDDPPADVYWRAGDGGSSALRQLDLLAAQIVPTNDLERQNWIARAPRYLPRAMRLERHVAMSEQERSAFLAAVDDRAQQGTLAARVEIGGGGQLRSFG
jgi:hypothetical protein